MCLCIYPFIFDLLSFKTFIFQTCGFMETEESTTAEDGSTTTTKFLVFPSAPSEEQANKLKEMLELLKAGEVIAPELVRGTAVFQVSLDEVSSAV